MSGHRLRLGYETLITPRLFLIVNFDSAISGLAVVPIQPRWHHGYKSSASMCWLRYPGGVANRPGAVEDRPAAMWRSRETGLRLTRVFDSSSHRFTNHSRGRRCQDHSPRSLYIARRELGSSHLGNSRDLRICVAYRSAERTTVSGNLRKNSPRVARDPSPIPKDDGGYPCKWTT